VKADNLALARKLLDVGPPAPEPEHAAGHGQAHPSLYPAKLAKLKSASNPRCRASRATSPAPPPHAVSHVSTGHVSAHFQMSDFRNLGFPSSDHRGLSGSRE
jgi:hypothetical protein